MVLHIMLNQVHDSRVYQKMVRVLKSIPDRFELVIPRLYLVPLVLTFGPKVIHYILFLDHVDVVPEYYQRIPICV